MITFVHKLHCWVIPGAFVGAIPVRLKHGLSFFHSFLERFIDIAGKNYKFKSHTIRIPLPVDPGR